MFLHTGWMSAARFKFKILAMQIGFNFPKIFLDTFGQGFLCSLHSGMLYVFIKMLLPLLD
jgi:hypothetical protein